MAYAEIPTMIVDDQDDVRLLIRMIIETANEGLHVSGEAATGDIALERLDSDDPMVIVLDQMMPDMSGLETAAHIRARRPEQIIVLCSAYLDEELMGEAATVGVDFCIHKEDARHLPDLIRAIVARDNGHSGGND